MVMIRVFDAGAKDQKTAGDHVIGEMAARAEHFQPAVIVDELFAEIGCGVGLAPVEVVAALGKETGERTACLRQCRQHAVEMDEARQAARRELSRRHRPIDAFDKAPRRLSAEAGEEALHARKQLV